MTDIAFKYNLKDREVAVLEVLSNSYKSGEIYNVDLVSAKQYLNSALSRTYGSFVPYDAQNIKELDFGTSYDMQTSYLHEIYAVLKRINAFITKHANDEYMENAVNMLEHRKTFFEDWKPVADMIKFFSKKGNGIIIKGRKPSENTAPVRTLENTGTCSCCGRNVKLDADGKIVDHGFTTGYGVRNGNCFGVGFLPWELSAEGKVAYHTYYTNMLADTKNKIEFITKAKCLTVKKIANKQSVHVTVNSSDTDFEKYKSNIMTDLQNKCLFIEKTIANLDKEIQGWKKTALPK